MFLWLGSFYVIAGAGMIAGFARTKKPAAIVPLLPLTFVVGYQADLAYGSKVNRIRAEAENILQYERDLTDIPGGLPSIASIDAGRMKAQVRRCHDMSLVPPGHTKHHSGRGEISRHLAERISREILLLLWKHY